MASSFNSSLIKKNCVVQRHQLQSSLITQSRSLSVSVLLKQTMALKLFKILQCQKPLLACQPGAGM